MRALVCGVSGQDGAYLSQFLLGKGYKVWGTSGDAQMASLGNHHRLGVRPQLRVNAMEPTDFCSVLTALEASNPDEIYFLAGQTSEGQSFEQPAETLKSIIVGTLNLLEAIHFRARPVRQYHVGSSDCFGNVGVCAADEQTPFHPSRPCAVAKASAHWLIANYRRAFGLFACNGILFNQESPLRPDRLVTRKIVTAAARVAKGSGEKLTLGRLDLVHYWGWAPEYVRAMWLMLRQPQPDDFVITAGLGSQLEDFVERAFAKFGLDWKELTESSVLLQRPSDLTPKARGTHRNLDRSWPGRRATTCRQLPTCSVTRSFRSSNCQHTRTADAHIEKCNSKHSGNLPQPCSWQ
jgi:GDPmannose 4,6-dehydratase